MNSGRFTPPSPDPSPSRRGCRIVVQQDVFHVMRNYARLRSVSEAAFAPFREAVFTFIDEPGSQVDAVWWDIGGNLPSPVYPSLLQPPVDHPLLAAWLGQGIDWVRELVDATRKRGLEVFWSHRVSEAEGTAAGQPEKENLHPLKKAHPDWTVPAGWWWQGMWNLASPGLREHKVSLLRELAENYDLDGIQIDFSRHVPCLPPGCRWEMRHHVTEFLRQTRAMLSSVAANRKRPYLLAAKVPQTLAGCRIDGFDIAAWADEGLVDILTLGSRSISADVDSFREAAGPNVRLQPCFDDHHAPDGYRHGPIEFLRGVFASHWQKGADSVMVFNWPVAPPEVCRAFGAEAGSPAHPVALREIGSPSSLENKDKIFALDRRGGYPWADGYFNRNDDAPLPLALPAGTTAEISLSVADSPEQGGRLTLRGIFSAPSGVSLRVGWNGTALVESHRDSGWKDPQILSQPTPPSGGDGSQYVVDPGQRLIRIHFSVPSGCWNPGVNRIAIEAEDANPEDVFLEKLEAHLSYTSGGRGDLPPLQPDGATRRETQRAPAW